MTAQAGLQRIFEALEQTGTVYSPREDTLLMLDALEHFELRDKSVLDVGTGSGILAMYSALQGARVVATDISVASTQVAKLAARKLGVSVDPVLCDLGSAVSKAFDLVLFNPPYLPSDDRMTDGATDGGRDGIDVTERFLGQLPLCLKNEGFCVLLLSSLNDLERLRRHFPSLEFRKTASRSFLFEDLYVFRVSRI
jgi:release factor glutamine methyltransferase